MARYGKRIWDDVCHTWTFEPWDIRNMDLYISYATILFLSGYVFSEKENSNVFLKSKCKSILLPYVFWGIPALLFDGQFIIFKENIAQETALKTL